MKHLAELGEWSYGFRAVGVPTDPAVLARYPGARRILSELDIFECSPVLKGAGIGTTTDWVKNNGLTSDGTLLAICQRVAHMVANTELSALRRDDLIRTTRHRALTPRELELLLGG